MSKNWPKVYPFFVDFLHFPDAIVDAGGVKLHPIAHCFNAISLKMLAAIPVTGTGRSPDYQAAIKFISDAQKRGIAIRLVPMDFDETDLATALNKLMAFLGVKR